MDRYQRTAKHARTERAGLETPALHPLTAAAGRPLQRQHARLTVLALLLGLLLASCTVTSDDGNPPPAQNDHATITGQVSTVNADISFSPEIQPLTATTLRSQTRQAAEPFVPGQLLVTFEPEFNGLSLQEQRSVLQAGSSDFAIQMLQTSYDGVPALIELEPGTDTLAAAAELEQLPDVVRVQPNFIYQLLDLPRDEYLDRQWPLPLSGLPLAWEQRNTASDVVIAVLDAGFDLDHPDLQGVFITDGYDFCGSAGCGSQDSDVRPDVGETHGTHVTGIIAAAGNSIGISGVVNGGSNFILPVKVMYQGGGLTSRALIDALHWAAGLSVPGTPTNLNPADIINLSLGRYRDGGSDAALHAAVRQITAAGALLVAASGNNGEAEVMEPAAYPEVIAVGSANAQGLRSCFSNYGPELDLLAGGGEAGSGQLRNGSVGPFPGCSVPAGTLQPILSTIPGGDYDYEAGTSMAAPVVSGVAALVWADLGSSANAANVRQRLLDTAYGAGGRTGFEYGSGIVRADAALGLPGPGSRVTVRTDLAAITGSATLDLFGGSSSYTLAELPAGRHQVSAAAGTGSRQLDGSTRVTVAADSTAAASSIRLEP